MTDLIILYKKNAYSINEHTFLSLFNTFPLSFNEIWKHIEFHSLGEEDLVEAFSFSKREATEDDILGFMVNTFVPNFSQDLSVHSIWNHLPADKVFFERLKEAFRKEGYVLLNEEKLRISTVYGKYGKQDFFESLIFKRGKKI